MTYENILLDQTDSVLTIKVNRPKVRNAQSRLLLEEFDDALMSVADDDSVLVVIVAGARRALLIRPRPRQSRGDGRQGETTLRSPAYPERTPGAGT